MALGLFSLFRTLLVHAGGRKHGLEVVTQRDGIERIGTHDVQGGEDQNNEGNDMRPPRGFVVWALGAAVVGLVHQIALVFNRVPKKPSKRQADAEVPHYHSDQGCTKDFAEFCFVSHGLQGGDRGSSAGCHMEGLGEGKGGEGRRRHGPYMRQHRNAVVENACIHCQRQHFMEPPTA